MSRSYNPKEIEKKMAESLGRRKSFQALMISASPNIMPC